MERERSSARARRRKLRRSGQLRKDYTTTFWLKIGERRNGEHHAASLNLTSPRAWMDVCQDQCSLGFLVASEDIHTRPWEWLMYCRITVHTKFHEWQAAGLMRERGMDEGHVSQVNGQSARCCTSDLP